MNPDKMQFIKDVAKKHNLTEEQTKDVISYAESVEEELNLTGPLLEITVFQLEDRTVLCLTRYDRQYSFELMMFQKKGKPLGWGLVFREDGLIKNSFGHQV